MSWYVSKQTHARTRAHRHGDALACNQNHSYINSIWCQSYHLWERTASHLCLSVRSHPLRRSATKSMCVWQREREREGCWEGKMINLQNACDLLIYYYNSSSAHDESPAPCSRMNLQGFSTFTVCVCVCLHARACVPVYVWHVFEK